MADWNSVVGDETYRNIVGSHGLFRWNHRCKMLIDFCERNGLIITNTWFNKPKVDYTLGRHLEIGVDISWTTSLWSVDSETVWRMSRHCRVQILTLTTTYWFPKDSKRAYLDGIWRSYMIKDKECRILYSLQLNVKVGMLQCSGKYKRMCVKLSVYHPGVFYKLNKIVFISLIHLLLLYSKYYSWQENTLGKIHLHRKRN
jgi:hypothetical protein